MTSFTIGSQNSNQHAMFTCATSNVVLVAGSVPAAMSADEVFYWTRKWQADTAETLTNLNAGDAITFDSDDPRDITRWLLSVEDE